MRRNAIRLGRASGTPMSLVRASAGSSLQHNAGSSLQHNAALWQQFVQDHYLNDATVQLDIAFYTVNFIMIALQRRLLVADSEKAPLQAVMTACAAAVTLSVFFRPHYKRFRTPIVLATHLLTTVLRARVILSTASRQAVLWRGPYVEKGERAGSMLLGMLAITAVPLRLFEVLGLQQKCSMHVIVAMCYLAMHPYSALQGARLAYSNALFFVVHEVHDLVGAVVEGLLSAVSGLPADQQHTCSSCPGLVVYSALCLFGSVAAPLYMAHMMEQRAFRRWCIRRHTASGTQPAQAGYASGASGSMTGSSMENGAAATSHAAVEPNPALGASSPNSLANTASSSSSRNSSSTRYGSSSTSSHPTRSSMDNSMARDPLLRIVDANSNDACVPALGVFASVLNLDNSCVRWCVHVLVLLVLLAGCWLVSNAVALVLLPRVLSSQQLDRWCPNRPYAPYVIAGQVYDGL